MKNNLKDTVKEIIDFIGDDSTREGLIETPSRVVKSWEELFSGYRQNVEDYCKVFDEGYDELVLMKDIEMYSMCEHHMLPFIGKCHIAYIANGKIIGASKLARIMEVYARRLQVQERLGVQIADAIETNLNSKGVAVIIEAKHLCMCARGVNKQHSVMITSTMRGEFFNNSSARSELMMLIR